MAVVSHSLLLSAPPGSVMRWAAPPLHLPAPRGRMWAEKGGELVDIQLTQDAEYMLCVLYDAYIQRRKNGELAESAKAFGGSQEIQSEYISGRPTNDIDEAARELKRKGMLNALFADNELAESILSDDGIVYMEHQFENKADRITQRIATLRTIIFG